MILLCPGDTLSAIKTSRWDETIETSSGRRMRHTWCVTRKRCMARLRVRNGSRDRGIGRGQTGRIQCTANRRCRSADGQQSYDMVWREMSGHHWSERADLLERFSQAPLINTLRVMLYLSLIPAYTLCHSPLPCIVICLLSAKRTITYLQQSINQFSSTKQWANCDEIFSSVGSFGAFFSSFVSIFRPTRMSPRLTFVQRKREKLKVILNYVSLLKLPGNIYNWNYIITTFNSVCFQLGYSCRVSEIKCKQ